MQKYSLIVNSLKTRLDKYLAENLTNISRSQIQRDIEAGKVFINSKKVLVTKFVVRVNDSIEYHQEEKIDGEDELKATNTPLKILYNNITFI